MLVLSSSEIESCVSVLDMLEAAEEALLAQESGDFIMPERMHIRDKGTTQLVMPAISGNYVCTKLVSVLQPQAGKEDQNLYASVVLSDRETGRTLSLLEGSVLTGLRTGALGGLAAAYTTPDQVSRLGLIGTGTQGFYQVLFTCTVRNIKEITLFDRIKNKIPGFVKRARSLFPHVRFTVADTPADVLNNSELIITATNSKTPVIPDKKELFTGKHFIGVGSFRPEMREYPDALFQSLDEVVTDTDHAVAESGDIPAGKGLVRLGELINSQRAIDTSGTTFFKSVGMALSDLFAAARVYRNAREKGLGTEIDFHR